MERITLTLPVSGALDAAERGICEAALAQFKTIAEASEALGITRHAFKRRLVKHGIPHDSSRGGWRPRAGRRRE